MPTGYTQKLMAEGQSFTDFVLTCARAFGACIEMRDEPLDAPIPEFQLSDYHSKAIAEAQARLEHLQRMTPSERVAYGAERKAEEIKHAQKCLAEAREQNFRLNEMKLNVERWWPPTPEHTELKKFMLQQIGISSRDCSYSEKSLADFECKSPISFYADALAEAARSFKYHAEAEQEEISRTAGRNRWVQELRASLESKGNANALPARNPEDAR